MIKQIKYNRLADRFKKFLRKTNTKIINDDFCCEYKFDEVSEFAPIAYLYYFDTKTQLLDIYYDNLIWKYEGEKDYYKFMCDKTTITKMISEHFFSRYKLVDKNNIKIRYFFR